MWLGTRSWGITWIVVMGGAGAPTVTWGGLAPGTVITTGVEVQKDQVSSSKCLECGQIPRGSFGRTPRETIKSKILTSRGL